VKGSNELLRKIYEERVARGDRRISLVPASDLIGHDGEGTVDGVHPNDLGFLRMADAIEPHLRKAIE
jgi:lysophospholipase L1-like esterase